MCRTTTEPVTFPVCRTRMAAVQVLLHLLTSFILLLFSIRSGSQAGRSCPMESTLPFRNFHEWCFAYVGDPMPWQQAREKCERAGGDLAKIENSAENGFASSLILHEVPAWIGLSDRLIEGKFNWTDRTPMSYANWGSREPNNYQDEDCVVLTETSNWSDRQCWKSYPFICETNTVADCCPMDIPDSLLMDTNQTTEGTTVHFRCAPGYYMSGGDETRTCQPNEVWSGVMPQCHKKNCGTPSKVSLATWSGGTLYGDRVTYVCKPGYQLSSGNSSLLCGPRGTWLGDPPTCTKGTGASAQTSGSGQSSTTPVHKTWYIYVICGLVLLSILIVILGVFLWRRYASKSDSFSNGYKKGLRDQDPLRQSIGSTDTSVTVPEA